MTANASRDENFVPTLLGVSSTDGITPVPIWANPDTHALYVESVSFSGAAAPTSTPTALGQIYVRTSNGKVYISVGTSSSADWAIMN